MGFLDKLMGKGGHWFDCQKTLSGLSGSLSRLPAPQIKKEDGLFSAYFVPDDKSVLNNRNGVRNQNDMLELRVRLDMDRGDMFYDAFFSVLNDKVWVAGALVNDDAKESKAELHPLDAIWALLPEDAYPEWVKGLRQNLRVPTQPMAVYRVMAVSDASKSGAPPPALEDRSLVIPIAYPPQPSGAPNMEIKYDIKPACVHNTDYQLNDERLKQRLELRLPLKALKNDGPTVFVADLAVFWN